jgi:hypothetical protein
MRFHFEPLLLALVLASPFSAIAQSNETLALQLNEGSRIVGQSVTNSFTLRTSFGRLVIPWENINRITFLNTNGLAQVNLSDGNQVQGTSVARKIGVATVFGRLFIGDPLIVQIDVGDPLHRFFGQMFTGDNPLIIPCDTLFSEQTRMPVTHLPQPIGPLTWTFWIRTTQTTTAAIVAKDIPGGPSSHDFFLGINDTSPTVPNKLVWIEGTSSSDFKHHSAHDVNDGKWHHVAVVRHFAAKTVTYFIDGVSEGPATNSLMWEIDNSQPLTVGAVLQGYPFIGEIRDMRFYPKALTGLQIQKVIVGQLPPSNGLIVLFEDTVELPTLP